MFLPRQGDGSSHRFAQRTLTAMLGVSSALRDAQHGCGRQTKQTKSPARCRTDELAFLFVPVLKHPVNRGWRCPELTVDDIFSSPAIGGEITAIENLALLASDTKIEDPRLAAILRFYRVADWGGELRTRTRWGHPTDAVDRIRYAGK